MEMNADRTQCFDTSDADLRVLLPHTRVTRPSGCISRGTRYEFHLALSVLTAAAVFRLSVYSRISK